MRQEFFNGRSTVFLSRATSETGLPAGEGFPFRPEHDFGALRRDYVLIGGILLPRYCTMFVNKEYGSQDRSPTGKAFQGEASVGPRRLRHSIH